ncbi:alpha/beta fold hydrolase [Albimonas pacifica]|uniref:Lysophospholipase, alpha-beta hydrolase superfamily n=1 Tax=Albimonas pacifica TaxID=1114924 RepID=A0A1I3GZ98_9RHOB|nr:alpha/beta hydrolase [Albimonas pacifica]SFI28696.1 Lysophospholipase, alpha-beta hydrolase superfamily [Albimonas pacifica]
MTSTLADAPLPPSIRVRRVDGVNGLSMQILEAGHETPDRPLALLLHGFPELAYSWRRVMPALAEAGFHVVAPDQRGYGGTTGWDGRYDGDLAASRMLNLATDALTLVRRLGRERAELLVGHDFGSPVASWAALTRPDVFERVALMSAPFAGPPPLPPGPAEPPAPDIDAALAALPRPRKHYQHHYATREAEAEMLGAPQGLHAFLRAYYHMKSADWAQNAPHPLDGWTAEALAQMPTYYVMDRACGMAETVAPHMPDAETLAANDWLTDPEMAVYAEAFARTGFQGALNWYRCSLDPAQLREHRLFAGRRIEAPAIFLAGASDWGIYQKPGADIRAMDDRAFARFHGVHLIEGAGHWVQQEQPEATVARLLAFAAETGLALG